MDPPVTLTWPDRPCGWTTWTNADDLAEVRHARERDRLRSDLEAAALHSEALVLRSGSSPTVLASAALQFGPRVRPFLIEKALLCRYVLPSPAEWGIIGLQVLGVWTKAARNYPFLAKL